MLSSIILSAVFLACGSMADNHGGNGGGSGGGYGGGNGGGNGEGNGWSSAEATAAPSAVSTAAANAAETWSSWSAAEASSSPGSVLVQVVQVSNPDGTSLKYYPEKIQAPPGSWVQFQFYPKNHTVTQSTFANPCVPINSIMSNVTGFKSGFMPVTAGADLPVYSIPVQDTNPIWLYCGQGPHCQKGMAMVINEKEGSNKTLEAYKAAAALVAVPGASSSSSSKSSAAPTSSSSSAPTSFSSAVVATTPAPAVPTTIPASVPTTTTGTAPAIFSGAANKNTRDIVGGSSVAGLFFAAVALLL